MIGPQRRRLFGPRKPPQTRIVVLRGEVAITKTQLAELRQKAAERDDYYRAIEILQPRRHQMLSTTRAEAVSWAAYHHAQGWLKALDDFGEALSQAMRERQA